jgi:hypothetical protein
VVSELVERGITGRDLFEIVEFLTGLPTLHAIQVIACEQGADIGDALGATAEPTPTMGTR